MNTRLYPFAISLICIFSVGMKVWFLYNTVVPLDALLTGDIPLYLELADSLYEQGQFGTVGPEGFTPNLLRTPGYPAFIVAIRLLVGNSLIPLLLVQAILSGVICFLVYWLARRRCPEPFALLAAMVVAVDPATIHHTLLPLTESLFTLALVFAVIALVRWKSSVSLYWLAGSALGLSATVLIRPISMYLVIPLLPFVWRTERSWQKTLLYPILWLILFLAPMAGWTLRNAVVAGVPTYCSISSYSFLLYRGAGVKAKLEGIPFMEAQSLLKQEMAEAQAASPLPLRDYLQAVKQKGLNYVIQHPIVYARVHLEGMVRALFGPAVCYLSWRLGGTQEGLGILTALENGNLREGLASLPYARLGVSIVELGFSLALIGFSVWAVWRASRGRDWELVLMGVVCLYFILISGGPEAGARFRVPIIPFLAVLSSYAFSLWWPGAKRSRGE
ncbi:MAG: glycosyltransferase family 39 protein [bacterium]|jgi:4-amino-4-deoxy-L-arabinose transferase-like glycosyltransferase|nr:glycosyltransferase family 39 protein [bacterium]